MKSPQIHLRDFFWLVLVVALGLAWGSERLRRARTINEISHFSILYLSEIESDVLKPEYPNSFGDPKVNRRSSAVVMRSKSPHGRNARNDDKEPLTSRGFANP